MKKKFIDEDLNFEIILDIIRQTKRIWNVHTQNSYNVCTYHIIATFGLRKSKY